MHRHPAAEVDADGADFSLAAARHPPTKRLCVAFFSLPVQPVLCDRKDNGFSRKRTYLCTSVKAIQVKDGDNPRSVLTVVRDISSRLILKTQSPPFSTLPHPTEDTIEPLLPSV